VCYVACLGSVSVVSVNGNGKTQSRPFGQETLLPAPPRKPSITRVYPRVDGIYVEWQQDQDIGGANVTNFSLSFVAQHRSPVCSNRNVMVSATSLGSYVYDMSDLCSRVEYTVELRSFNGYQWSDKVTAGPMKTFGLPGVTSNASLTISTKLEGLVTWLWMKVNAASLLPGVFFRIIVRCESPGEATHTYTTNTSSGHEQHTSNLYLFESNKIDLEASAGQTYVVVFFPSIGTCMCVVTRVIGRCAAV